jgi:PST family polysaccharide transporter
LNRKVDAYFAENKAYAGLGRASLYSGMIMVAGRCVSIASQVISMVLLGRLLSPHDFGLVAMVLALIGFGPMFIDLGTTEACAQKTHITRGEVASLFWLNVVAGTILTIIIAGASPAIASFYGEGELSNIIRFSAIIFILTALANQHIALMRRAMEFRRLAVIDIVSNVASSILSIAMAFGGFGYWALVAKPVAMGALTLAGVWISCPWVPGRPSFSHEVKETVRFGLGVTGFTMTDYVARSADRLVLGYFYGAVVLGYYQTAFLLYGNLLSLLTEPLHNIAVSALSKMRQDMAGFKRSWAAALSPLSFVSCLAFATLAATGQDFIVILLGQKWAPAGSLLSIFALRGIAQSAERTLGWLHVSAGRPDRWMRWGVVSAVVQLAVLFACLPFGLAGVATGYAIANFVLVVPALAYAGHPVGIGTRDVLAAAGPQTVAGLFAAAFAYAVQTLLLGSFTEWTRFFITCAICLVSYLAVAIGIFRATEPLNLALSILRDFAAKRLRASS